MNEIRKVGGAKQASKIGNMHPQRYRATNILHTAKEELGLDRKIRNEAIANNEIIGQTEYRPTTLMKQISNR